MGKVRFWSLSTETLPHKNVLALLSCLSYFLATEFSCSQPCDGLVVIGDGKVLHQAFWGEGEGGWVASELEAFLSADWVALVETGEMYVHFINSTS